MVAGLLLSLFFTQKTLMRSGTQSIFFSPSLSLSAASEAALVARRWYTALYSSTLITYTDTTSLLQCQKVDTIIIWEAAVNMLDQWAVLLMVILGEGILHPTVYYLTMLIDGSE